MEYDGLTPTDQEVIMDIDYNYFETRTDAIAAGIASGRAFRTKYNMASETFRVEFIEAI